MLSRRIVLGSLAVVGVGLVAVGAVAAFAHGPGGHHRMMKRVASGMIDDALEPAKINPEQRARIYAARDRAFAAVEAHHQARRVHMDAALALFEADRIDSARLAEFRAAHEAEHRQVADAIVAGVTEIHDVLTADQRKAVADWVRAHRPS
jgi:Spy/CpxP family protein refolding chaperone